MTASEADDDTDYDAPGVCWDCGEPCLTHKGDVHGWRCTACIDRYLDEAQARWDARPAKAKERASRNLLHGNDNRTSRTANTDRRQEAVPRAVCRPSPGVDRTGEGGGSVTCSAPPDDHHLPEGQTT